MSDCNCPSYYYSIPYYFFATLFRMTNPQIYEAMMLPVPWLMAQGIITLTFIAFGFCFLSERHIEFGDIGAEKERANAFRELATVDPLTGLRNRRTFTEMLEQERKRACRMERPLTLALLDLDGFKGVNDTQGHKAGDDVLKTVAGYIKSGLRQGIDIPFRYGGDEFFIIFPETDLHMAQAIAERMKSEVKFATNGQITLSIGLLDATLASHLTPEDLVHQVDEAMYAAKKGGGDSIVSATCKVDPVFKTVI